MSDVILRVTRLIALASSPNENEARNAAHQACKLIREHKLMVVESNGASDERRRRPAAQSAARGFPCVGCGVVQHFVGFTDFARFFSAGALCASCKREAERAEARRREEARKREQAARAAATGEATKKRVHTRVGVWSVDCGICGRSAPSAKSQPQASQYAEDAGFTMNDEGMAVCPTCAAREARMG